MCNSMAQSTLGHQSTYSLYKVLPAVCCIVWNHGKAGACGLVLCPARLFIFRGTHMTTEITFDSSHVSASYCKVTGEAELAQQIWAPQATWQQWSLSSYVQRLAKNGHPTKGPQSLTSPQNKTQETCSEWAKSKSFGYAILLEGMLALR